MNERLSLAGIREGAMNPPAGGAAGAEDFLWNQLLQAREDERQAELAPLREASNRALHRSGWYNVGSMLMPQDAGDVALSMAMGPGLGRLSRVALAALGGLTTMPGEAEGALLPWDRLRRAVSLTGREGGPLAWEGERAARGLERASDATARLRGADAAPIRFPAQYSADEVNRAFDSVAQPIFNETGWLPFPNMERGTYDWLYGLSGTDRHRWPTGNILAGFRVGQPARELGEELTDRTLFAAVPELQRTRLMYGPENQTWNAAHVPGTGGAETDLIIMANRGAGTGAAMNESLGHETQHVMQRLFGRMGGTSPARVAEQNPDLYERYFGGLAAMYPNEPVQQLEQLTRSGMYRRVPGEWEATVGGALSGRPGANSMLLHELSNGIMPDFALRNRYQP